MLSSRSTWLTFKLMGRGRCGFASVAIARTPADHDLVKHSKARIAFARGEVKESEQILKLEIQRGRNLVPNLGLLTQVQCSLYDQNKTQFPAIAKVALASAEDSLEKIRKLDPSNRFIEAMAGAIAERRAR